MKKTFSIILCFVLFISLALPTYAAGQSEVIYSQEYTLEDGTTVKDEIIVHGLARTSYKTATRRATISKDDTTIAIIAFQATFRFDGSTVAVISKSVTQTDTYEGWSYKQTSFTSSGGTVTLEGKLTKLLIFNNSFTMTLTCDKNGNISST
ncbi:MAG: hypothetical protein IIV61_04945 [Oscillospiraceae bacterium]|nr:hypothetical protein [Oscillospiraceae bacterium]MBQ5711941.1 hypothetical protein [Oscillospiraceae bacterium]